MATDAQLQELYGRLRQQLLERHFAFGRYWRANLFSIGNTLEPDANRPVADALRQREQALLAAAAGGAEPPALTEARWRVQDHARENALMATGLRLVQLAIEHRLGVPESLTAITLTLRTLASLYKFDGGGSPFAGYIVRRDAALDDDWTVERDDDGRATPKQARSFFTNADPAAYLAQPYLYSPPLDDPRYVARKQDGEYIPNRGWEPSKDELCGLVAGYAAVFDLLRDDAGAAAAIAEVRRQVDNLGRYLAYGSYLLLRPGGGFVARGAADFAPALEYPLSRVFQRITGNAHPADGDFELTLHRAGVWECVHPALSQPDPPWLTALEAAGPAGPALALALRSLRQALDAALGVLTGVVGGALAALLQGALEDAARARGLHDTAASIFVFRQLTRLRGLFDRRGCFDVASHGELDSDQNSFAVAYALMLLPSPRARFLAWMATPPMSLRWADYLKPYVGLMALGDDDPVLRGAYLDWYDRYVKHFTAAELHEVGDVVVSNDPDTRDGPWCATALNVAIATLLRGDGAEPAEEHKLADALGQAFTTLAGHHHSMLPLTDDPMVPVPDGAILESPDRSQFRWHGGYLVCLALAWLHAKRKSASTPPVAGFPSPPGPSTSWPTPRLSAARVADAMSGMLQVPIEGARRGPLTSRADLPLLVDAPDKPNDPNALMPSRAPVVLLGGDRCLNLLALGSDDRVWRRTQVVPNGDWGAWRLVTPRGAVRRLAAARNHDGRLSLFAIGLDTGLYHLHQHRDGSFGDWQLLAAAALDLTVARNADGRLEVFSVRADPNRPIEHGWQVAPGQTWSDWASLGFGDGQAVQATANADGRLSLFAVCDGHLWHRWQTPSNSGWNDEFVACDLRQPVRRATVATNQDGRLEVFALDGAGTARHLWQLTPNAVWTPTSSGWSPWAPLGNGGPFRRLVAARNADGRLEVFAAGVDGQAWHIWQVQANGDWSSWAPMGTAIDGAWIRELAVAANADRRLELFALHSDGSLAHAWQTSPSRGPWSTWARLY